MLGKGMSKLTFDENWSRDGESEFIAFGATDGERSLTAKVSREALEDLHGSTPPGADWVTLFDPLRARVENALQSKFDAGQLEPDGSLMLRSDDLG
jgi:hypothetical protein